MQLLSIKNNVYQANNHKVTVCKFLLRMISRISRLERTSALVEPEPRKLNYQSSRAKPSLTADLIICQSAGVDWLLCWMVAWSKRARPKRGMVEMHVTGRHDVWAMGHVCSRALPKSDAQPCAKTTLYTCGEP